MINRRQALQAAAGAAALGIAAPAIAQAATKVRVGYLHTLAVDGQIWLGMERGSFAQQSLDLELRQFNTGLELFQAMVGGSLDNARDRRRPVELPSPRAGQGVP